MGKTHILQALTQLSPAERLAVIEEALHLLRQELAQTFPEEGALQQAAHALLDDYLHDPELTAFTSLDSEAWDETG